MFEEVPLPLGRKATFYCDTHWAFHITFFISKSPDRYYKIVIIPLLQPLYNYFQTIVSVTFSDTVDKKNKRTQNSSAMTAVGLLADGLCSLCLDNKGMDCSKIHCQQQKQNV